MKTTLKPDGGIALPVELLERDELHAGDAFELERLAPGNYLLTRSAKSLPTVAIVSGSGGLLALKAPAGVIIFQMVKEIESQAG